MGKKIYIILLFLLFLLILINNINAKIKNFDELLKIGVENLKQNEYTEALKICEETIEKFQGKEKEKVRDAYHFMALIFLCQGEEKTDKAIISLIEALSRDQNNPVLHREVGLAYKIQHQFSLAKTHLNKAIALNSQDVESINALLEIYKSERRNGLTISLYEKLLVVTPEDANVWFKLGKAQIAEKKIEKAKESIVEAIRLNSKFTEARLKLAELFENEGNWDSAIDQYESIVNYDNDNERANTKLKFAVDMRSIDLTIDDLIKQGKLLLDSSDSRDWGKSIILFNSVLDLDSQNKNAKKYLKKGKQKLYNHCYKEAQRLRKQRRWQRAFDNLVISLGCAESDSDRKAAFKELKVVSPELGRSVAASNAQDEATRLLKSGKFEQALKKYTAIEELNPRIKQDIQPDRNLAEIGMNYQNGIYFLKNKKYGLAKAHFEKVITEDSTYKDVHKLYNEADSLMKCELSKNIFTNRYINAINKEQWESAKGYLEDLVVLEPSNVKFKNDLELVKEEIQKLRRELRMGIFFILLATILVFILLNKTSREFLLNKTIGIFSIFQDIPFRPVFVILVLPIFAGLYLLLVKQGIFPSVSSLLGIVISVSFLFLAIIIIMALIQKKMKIKFELLVDSFNFVLWEKRESEKHISIIPESSILKADFINLGTVNHLEFEGELRESVDENPLCRDKIFFKPKGKNMNILFHQDGQSISISDLRIKNNSSLYFARLKNENSIIINTLSNNTFNYLNLGQQFQIKASGFQIYTHQGTRILTNSNIFYVNLYNNPEISFKSNNGIFPIKIKFQENEKVENIFKIANGKKLRFYDVDAFQMSSMTGKKPRNIVEKGTAEILNDIGETKNTIVITSTNQFNTQPDHFNDLNISMDKKNFIVNYARKYSSFKFGTSSKLTEMLPSSLKNFRDEKGDLAVIISISYALLAFVLSIIDITRK